LKSVNKVKDYKLISIDPSTRSLAYAILDSNNNIHEVGKIDISSCSSFKEKLFVIGESLPEILKKHKPEVAVIEEAVFIQNFRTSKSIAYVIGHSIGVISKHCKLVVEANPIVWKGGIGYKKVSKKEKEEWTEEFGEKESKRIASLERKNRVRVIICEMYGEGFDGDKYDSDEMDAIAIGVWYNIKRKKDGQEWG
jgi:Holliday junction resolvasome RuvABC endonuclease subunit